MPHTYAPITPNFPSNFNCEIIGIMLRNRCWSTTFTLLQSNMPMDSVRTGWCDQPLVPQSHQTFRSVPTVELLGIMLRNRCWPTTAHTITAVNADRWCHKWLGHATWTLKTKSVTHYINFHTQC